MKGVYILFLRVLKDTKVKVGSLGLVSFSAGVYAYVGSAQNNVEARVMRHFRKHKTLRWHIDYLLSSEEVKPQYAIVFPLPRKYECVIAEFLQGTRSQKISRFGASDCRCKSHLFNIKSQSRLIRELEKSLKLRRPIKYIAYC